MMAHELRPTTRSNQSPFSTTGVRRPPPPGTKYASHHLTPSFASRVRWGCAAPATTSTHLSRSMEVCCASHHFHPSFTSRVRWVYALPATTSTHCSRLAFDGCVLSQPPPPPVVRPEGAATVSSRSRLAFGEVVPCQPAPPPVVCISRLMGSHVRRVHPAAP